jgi:hypothetical protein
MSNQNPVINNAIQANMNAMRDMLEKAAALAQEGCGYMDDGNRNAAIGSIIDLDRLLGDAKALHEASLALHRQ